MDPAELDAAWYGVAAVLLVSLVLTAALGGLVKKLLARIH
jgi:hypothetical protein